MCAEDLTMRLMTATAIALVAIMMPRALCAQSIPPPADVKAPPKDAKTTASGLAYKSIKAGTGTRHPTAASSVTVHYTGWTTDGKMFDSSVVRGQPSTFSLDGVIAGWTEGLQLMFEGEKTRFWIPEKLAYEGKKAPYGLLVFDVELIKIVQ
jgi:FKBP-type peptidyl-prolyl cis-trans isomerase